MSSSSLLKAMLRIKLATIIVTLLVIMAIMLSLLRLSMYYLPDYKDSVEQWLSSDKYEVSINALDGEWNTLWPRLNIYGMQLNNADGVRLLEFDELELELNLADSLWQQKPVFRNIRLDRLELKIIGSAKGRWILKGLDDASEIDNKLQDEGVDAAQFWADLSRHGQIELVNSLILVTMPNGEKIPPQMVNARIRNRGDSSALSVRLEHSSGVPIEFRALVNGIRSAELNANFYFNIPGYERPFWLPLLVAEVPQLSQLNLSAEVWGQWQGGQLNSLQGRLQIPQLGWKNQAYPQLENFAADIAYSALVDGKIDFNSRPKSPRNPQFKSQIQIANLEGRLSDRIFPFSDINLQWDASQGSINMAQLSLPQLDLASVDELLMSIEQIPEAVKSQLKILQPKGQLHNVSITVPGFDKESLEAFELTADLDRVAVAAWNGAPELVGVDGLLRLSAQDGQVDFDSLNLRLNFPKIYRQGWDLNRARGSVGWRLDDAAVWVESGLIQGWMEGVEVNARFSLDMPYADNTESNFTLAIGVDNSDGTLAPLFVPDKVVPPKLFDWLSQSIIKGKVNTGSFLFQGPLESWAADPSVQMYFDVSDATLKYDPNWPAIQSADAQVMVKGTEVLVDIAGGQIYQSRVNGGRVYLPPGSAGLQVKASVTGSAADGRKVLLESPIGEYLGKEFAGWQLRGQAHTNLDLVVDLDNPEKSKIKVDVSLEQGRYFSEALDLTFDDIQGDLKYRHDKGLMASGLRARFLDKPIVAKITSQQKSDGAHTLIAVTGKVEVKRLNQWLKQPIVTFFSGTTNYRAELDLCASSPDCSRLSVKSNLKGVSSTDIPAPFKKSANQSRELVVRTQLGTEQNWLRVIYGNDFHGLMLLEDDQLKGGEWVIGKGQGKPKLKREGLYIRGRMVNADVLAWQKFLNKLFPTDSAVSESTKSGENTGITIDPLIARVDLEAEKLSFGDADFASIRGTMSPEGKDWRIDIASPDVAGVIRLPSQGNQPYVGDFTRFYLAEKKASEEAAGETTGARPSKTDPLQDFDPRQLPQLRFAVDDFRIGDSRYGQWEFAINPAPDGVHVSGIEGVIHKLNTKADLWWAYDGGKHNTRVVFSVSADQLADVQQDWSGEAVLEAENANASGELSWNGSPLFFSTENLAGHVSFETGVGRFYDVGAAGGALKLFGLLNYKALGRRLRLDFSDLYKEGLTFDKITGAYKLKGGVATSTEPLRIKGPSTDMRLSGSIDLARETLDQEMEVKLPVAENLSLTAVIVGAPVVGGTIYLVDKLLGKPLSKVASAKYTIVGAWDQPEVKPVKMPRTVHPSEE